MPVCTTDGHLVALANGLHVDTIVEHATRYHRFQPHLRCRAVGPLIKVRDPTLTLYGHLDDRTVCQPAAVWHRHNLDCSVVNYFVSHVMLQ
jgi:hypothetical protein